MRYDGYQTDAPIAENIVGMAFEYFADPSPPFLLKSVTDPIGPWTNYGPKPPAVGVNVARTTGARAKTASSWCRAALMWHAQRWRRRWDQ